MTPTSFPPNRLLAAIRAVTLAALVGSLPGALVAQAVNYEDVVPPPGTRPETFADYLVQQAWTNNAITDELAADRAIADIEIGQARRSWLDQINANVNFSSRTDTLGFFGNNRFGEADQQYLFPGFNYGLSLNVGGLVQTRSRVRVAQQQRRIADSRENQQRLELRAEVLDRLVSYDNARRVLGIRNAALVDAEVNMKLAQNLYDQGKAQFQDKSRADDTYHTVVESVSLAELQVARTRIALEEIVGLPIETITAARVLY